MIEHPAFTAEEWRVLETKLHLDILAQCESIFALSNGHIGLRGNLDEGEPYGLPGTYLNSVYELHPLPYAEGGYGYPESGQTVINVTNGKIIRLLVDDEPFDVRYGELQAHERELGGAEGIVSVIFHCALVAESFRRAGGRLRTLSYEDLDAAARGEPLPRLEEAQLPLHEFIKANVENEEAQKLIAMIALAIDGVS